MHIRSYLKGAIEPCDEIYFILNGIEWAHCGRQFVKGLYAEMRILFPQGSHDITQVPLGDDMVRFARKKTTSYDTDGNIEVSHSLWHGLD